MKFLYFFLNSQLKVDQENIKIENKIYKKFTWPRFTENVFFYVEVIFDIFFGSLSLTLSFSYKNIKL